MTIQCFGFIVAALSVTVFEDSQSYSLRLPLPGDSMQKCYICVAVYIHIYDLWYIGDVAVIYTWSKLGEQLLHLSYIRLLEYTGYLVDM